MRRSRLMECAGYELHVSEWGSPDRDPVLLWHGLARTGRDFDELAWALSERYWCLCPDMIGRGLSEWARDPVADYCFARYGEVAAALVEETGADRVRWIGTSMGGLLGVHLAGGALKGRVSRLVINDVGPAVPEAAVARIVDYVGKPPAFGRLSEAEAYLRRVYTPFGPNTDAFWRRMAASSVRRREDGRLTLHYDPRIVAQFESHPEDGDLWTRFEAVDCPILLVRGAASDVLPAELAGEMAERNPNCRLIDLEGYGHAPTLARPQDAEFLSGFLN